MSSKATHSRNGRNILPPPQPVGHCLHESGGAIRGVVDHLRRPDANRLGERVVFEFEAEVEWRRGCENTTCVLPAYLVELDEAIHTSMAAYASDEAKFVDLINLVQLITCIYLSANCREPPDRHLEWHWADKSKTDSSLSRGRPLFTLPIERGRPNKHLQVWIVRRFWALVPHL